MKDTLIMVRIVGPQEYKLMKYIQYYTEKMIIVTKLVLTYLPQIRTRLDTVALDDGYSKKNITCS